MYIENSGKINLYLREVVEMNIIYIVRLKEEVKGFFFYY